MSIEPNQRPKLRAWMTVSGILLVAAGYIFRATARAIAAVKGRFSKLRDAVHCLSAQSRTWRSLSLPQLQKILTDHESWLTTHAQRGARAALRGVDLRNATLINANLRKADLAGTNLSGADLTGACLCESNLAGADLTAVVGLSSKHVAGADLTAMAFS